MLKHQLSLLAMKTALLMFTIVLLAMATAGWIRDEQDLNKKALIMEEISDEVAHLNQIRFRVKPNLNIFSRSRSNPRTLHRPISTSPLMRKFKPDLRIRANPKLNTFSRPLLTFNAINKQKLLNGEYPRLTDKDLPLMDRAVLTFLYNGMNKRGGRAHTMVVKDGKITENNIYESQGPQDYLHGERYVPEFKHSTPNVLVYMDKTPCTRCADYLLEKYKNVPKAQRPQIHASYLFSYGDNEASIIESIKKLEELHNEGFKICPADINQFSSLIDVEPYRDIIREVAETEPFIKGQIQLREYLKNIC